MPDKSEGQNQEEITRKMYQRLDAEHMDTIRSHTNHRTGRRWDETKTAAHGINSKLLLLLYCSNSYLTFGSDIGKLGLKSFFSSLRLKKRKKVILNTLIHTDKHNSN